ncbi:MAG: CAP domain-containing protein [Polyangiaceae bacterium]
MQTHRLNRCSLSFVIPVLLAACSSGTVGPSLGTGGTSDTANGGTSSPANGGAANAGTSNTGNGGNNAANGGAANAGTSNTGNGGAASGGTSASTNGGSASGGTSATSGGATTGGRGNSGGRASGGTATTTGGSASGGTTSGGSSFGGASTAGAPSGAEELCARWKGDRVNLTEDAWNGNASTCTAGDMTTTARDTVLRLVNLYRYIAALPAVAYDATRNQQDQACALMMQANNTINHTPPSTWTCYTAAGATAAGSSNLAGSGAIPAVDAYMLDPGNATTLGHRRWILSNSLGPIGVGSTGKYSCMWTLNGTGKAGKAWTAWPSPGVFPLQAFTASRQSVDSTGWSIQSDSINLAGAQVAVTLNGTNQPVTVTQLDANYGSRYAIRFNPSGWTTAAGTYHVAVTGIATAIEYDINVVSCN